MTELAFAKFGASMLIALLWLIMCLASGNCTYPVDIRINADISSGGQALISFAPEGLTTRKCTSRMPMDLHYGHALWATLLFAYDDCAYLVDS